MSQRRSPVDIAEQYARDVVAGDIPACKWVKAACRRHLEDRKREAKKVWPYRFDVAKAERVCKFIELLPHIKGPKAGQRIKLEPWQVFILCVVFGWVRKDTGKRRFRKAYVEVPRGNAKSTLSAGIGLYMLALDGEGGAECYSAATTRDQAKIVFSVAQQMARRCEQYRKRFRVDVNAHNINQVSSASKFEALSADHSSLDGLNIHFAAVDELHAHRTREVYDVLETGTGKRDQSLLWSITTAGSNRAGICYEVRTYITKILDGQFKDESTFGIIYTIDDEDDWADPEVWIKANPNWGVSVMPDVVGQLAHKAMQMPSAQNNFKTKHLDVWVNADVAWMDMRAWDRCADETLDIAQFEKQPCVVGLDLASKRDIAADYKIFKKVIEKDSKAEAHYYGFGRFYLPEAAVEDSPNSQYEGWVEQGRLIKTPGNITDYDYIENNLKEDASRFQVEEIAYDPYQATQLATHLQNEGFKLVEMRPTVLNFSEAMKEFEALVLTGRFHHDGCPVMSWMVSNVVCHRDTKDNIYPRKEREENKIDGVVAALMALGRLVRRNEAAAPSVYLI